MALPAQVQRDAELADEMMRQAAAASEPPAEAAPQEAPVTPPAAPAAPTPTPEPSADEAARWEQRYKTLQGMFDADRKRQGATIQELERQLAQLTEQLKAKPQAAEPAPERPATPTVTSEDVDNFGADLIGLIQRVAGDVFAVERRKLEAAMAAKDKEIAELREQVGGAVETTRKTATQIFFDDLRKAVPDWETINQDERFLTWLGQVDELSGVQRQAYLDSALQAGNVARTAKLFDAWKALQAPPAAAQEAAPAPPSPTQELARQVQPSASQAAPVTPSGNASKIWTAAEVEQFYKDATRGAYRNDPDAVARINAEIDLAMMEGRVRP